jgi:N-ethylmaleimide reductase
LFQSTHVSGWKLVTDAVHARGGRIVVQLMHTGRVSHQANLPAGAEVLGPSPEICPGEMWTDAQGSQPHTAPRAMSAADIAAAMGRYIQAARLAIKPASTASNCTPPTATCWNSS